MDSTVVACDRGLRIDLIFDFCLRTGSEREARRDLRCSGGTW